MAKPVQVTLRQQQLDSQSQKLTTRPSPTPDKQTSAPSCRTSCSNKIPLQHQITCRSNQFHPIQLSAIKRPIDHLAGTPKFRAFLSTLCVVPPANVNPQQVNVPGCLQSRTNFHAGPKVLCSNQQQAPAGTPHKHPRASIIIIVIVINPLTIVAAPERSLTKVCCRSSCARSAYAAPPHIKNNFGQLPAPSKRSLG